MFISKVFSTFLNVQPKPHNNLPEYRRKTKTTLCLLYLASRSLETLHLQSQICPSPFFLSDVFSCFFIGVQREGMLIVHRLLTLVLLAEEELHFAPSASSNVPFVILQATFFAVFVTVSL